MTILEIINQLGKQRHFFIKSQGTSMLPTIHPNDVVYLKKVSFGQIKINDIVLAQKNKKYFIHRVIYKSPSPSPQGWYSSYTPGVYLITKGDNAAKSDGKILPRQIIAKVYQIKRNSQVFKPDDINLMQSTLYFQEIIKLKNIWQKQKIDFVYLKGLPLHLFIEKSHPKRFYADCDILVDPKDYDKIEKVLLEMKYKKADSAFSPTFAKLKDKPTEVSYYKKVNNFPVVFDIHFEPVFLMNQLGSLEALYPQELINQMTRMFLAEKRIVKIQNENFPLLSPGNLIIYLALHFFHHNFRGIYRLELLGRVVRKVSLVPPPRGSTLHTPEVYLSLAKKIKDYRLQNFVNPAFILLNKYFNTPISRDILDSITPDKNKLNYIKNNNLKVNVFSDQSRTEAGVERFKNIFYLSSEPFIKKLLIFTSLAVIYSIFWTLYRRLKRPHL